MKEHSERNVLSFLFIKRSVTMREFENSTKIKKISEINFN